MKKDSLLQGEFRLDDDLIHLNHAGVGPWPRRCAEAVQRFAETMCTRSYAGAFPEWIETEQRLRERLRALVNAPSVDDIALLKNTSDALSQVAHGLDWKPGDTVVALAEEFVSNLITWEALEQRGVRLVRVTPAEGESPEDALEAACDENTRLVTVSTVQYGTGYRLDCARIGAYCRARSILFCVDAVQSLGALRFDAQACHADFVVAGSHKWLMSPFGIALFWCRAELRDRLRPLAFGWHTVADPMRFGGTLAEIEPSARRYEAGTANWPALVGFEASLSLLDEFGHAEAERRVLTNAAYLADALAERPGVTLVSPREAGRFGGNVCVRVAGQDLAALAGRLEADGVLCAARGPSLRFSPHYYTERARIDAALTSFDRACML
ncbi:MAG: aminotransferase class V-fold PLP-dependent enzyme [Xanthomonadaceae bacterium]|nr:aminotransferase class V-fold PLP-dependent enzyme [Xanthomonadaceae bacterium]